MLLELSACFPAIQRLAFTFTFLARRSLVARSSDQVSTYFWVVADAVTSLTSPASRLAPIAPRSSRTAAFAGQHADSFWLLPCLWRGCHVRQFSRGMAYLISALLVRISRDWADGRDGRDGTERMNVMNGCGKTSCSPRTEAGGFLHQRTFPALFVYARPPLLRSASEDRSCDADLGNQINSNLVPRRSSRTE